MESMKSIWTCFYLDVRFWLLIVIFAWWVRSLALNVNKDSLVLHRICCKSWISTDRFHESAKYVWRSVLIFHFYLKNEKLPAAKW